MKTQGLMTAIAAAALLSISPVSAQVTGGPEVQPRFSLDERITPEMRPDLHQRFYDAPMPEHAEVRQVPPEIVEEYPEVAGYEYIALPGDRFILIDPETGEIAMDLPMPE